MNVPHYKECLGTKDMALWVSYCMPSTVANGCPMNSFNKLKDVFDGPACDDQVESMPPTPEYMNVPHYKECLGTKDMGLWVSYCMPSTSVVLERVPRSVVSERVPKRSGTTRNSFRISWNGTERVPKQLERSTTLPSTVANG